MLLAFAPVVGLLATLVLLFGFNAGATLPTAVSVLVEVPVMLSAIAIVNRSKGWNERRTAQARHTVESSICLDHEYRPENLARSFATPAAGLKGVELAESLAQLRATGADAVISMTPADELGRLEVAALPEAVADAGMRWFHFPIEDDAAPGPAFEQAWSAHRDMVVTLLSGPGSLAIHCRGDSGRTGLMAALILRELGMDGAQADAQVLRLRPASLALPVHPDYLAAHDGRNAAPSTNV